MNDPGAINASLPAVVDVPHLIDDQPVGRFQIRLLLICASVLFVDGFDTQAIGYVAPEIGRAWALPRGALGPVFSSGLFGLMIGALLFSPLADRLGRKWIIVVSTLAFGIATLATLLAGNVEELMTIRFLTGLGLGGALPNAAAMTAEFSPKRRRATMVMTMFCGFSAGAAVGGLIAAAMIPSFGWRSVFLVGGIAPLLLVPVLIASLPESPRFLALSGRANDKVGRILLQMFPAHPLPAGARFVVDEPAMAGISVAHLFRDGRAGMTILFWIVFFMSLLDLYFLSNWLPTVLNELGASVSLAALLGAMLQIGGILGTLVLGRFIDRFSFRALSLTYFAASLAILAIGQASHSTLLVGCTVFAAGFCIVGGQGGANALSSTFYPTALRSTGVGWSLGIGRIGSIVGPLVGGMILALHWATQSLFLAAALPALCAAIAAFLLGGLIRRAPRID